MSELSIPDKIHAVCPICGSGTDYQASQLTPADAQTNLSTDKVKHDLVWYEGDLMCELCKQNRINRYQSEIDADRQAEEQQFRDAAGFQKSIT